MPTAPSRRAATKRAAEPAAAPPRPPDASWPLSSPPLPTPTRHLHPSPSAVGGHLATPRTAPSSSVVARAHRPPARPSPPRLLAAATNLAPAFSLPAPFRPRRIPDCRTKPSLTCLCLLPSDSPPPVSAFLSAPPPPLPRRPLLSQRSRSSWPSLCHLLVGAPPPPSPLPPDPSARTRSCGEAREAQGRPHLCW